MTLHVALRCLFPKQFTVGFSLTKKGWSGICPPLCLPWVCFGRASKPCPPCVRVASALCPPWVRDMLCRPRPRGLMSALVFALSPLWPRLPPCVRHVSAMCLPCARLVSALSPLWPLLHTFPPRVRHVSASCPPCVRLESALAVSPNFVRHASAMSRPVFALGPALCPLWPRLQTLSAMCPPCLLSTMRPLKPWPCLWSLPALGLLWGRAVASSGKIISHHCATHSVYSACPLVSFLHIFILAHQIRPLLTHPMLENLFGVYAGIFFYDGILVALLVYDNY